MLTKCLAETMVEQLGGGKQEGEERARREDRSHDSNRRQEQEAEGMS